jgi:UDP-N-acetyl-2-amino-2-deoxyglucuronate dehydrogenase
MAETLKLAIVGCGGIAGAHLTGYENLLKAGYDKFDITAVCDTNPANTKRFIERLAASGMSPTPYKQVEDMVKAEQLDAADICTPHAFHHTAAIPCLRKGINVMVEKPVGITVKATKKMMKAAEKTGAMIATAEQVRRCMGSRVIEWAINKQNMIGKPRFFSMEILHVHPFDWSSYAMAWRGFRLLTGGGQILDGGVHFSDMMLHVFGPVAEVFCTMTCRHDATVNAPTIGKRKVDIEDTWLATLRFESGLIGHWSWSCTGFGHEVESGVYFGEKGSFKDRQKWMHAFQMGADLKRKNGKEVSYEQLEERYLKQLSKRAQDQLFPYGLSDGISNECWDFVEAVATGRPPEVDVHAGLAAKSLSYALYESATVGKPIRPADVASGKVRAYQKPIDEYWKI